MTYIRPDHKVKAVNRGKPRIVGIRRAPHTWKWKVYTDNFAPEFSSWSVALKWGNDSASM